MGVWLAGIGVLGVWRLGFGDRGLEAGAWESCRVRKMYITPPLQNGAGIPEYVIEEPSNHWPVGWRHGIWSLGTPMVMYVN